MEEILAVLVIAAASLGLYLFAALQVAHRFADARIDRRLRAAVLTELDDAPAETVLAPAIALALVSQLPVASLLLRASLPAAADAVLLVELAVAVAAGTHLAGGRGAAQGVAHR